MNINKFFKKLITYAVLGLSFSAFAATDMAFIDSQINTHPNQSGIYVLDKGEEALVARAWLADHAQKTIEVQYLFGALIISAYLPLKPYCARQIEE